MTALLGAIFSARALLRAFALALGFLVVASPGFSGPRPEGLLWNRSGLAATLPLQVKTTDGSDYLLQLFDPETAQVVLAAYIRGGAFFRVLVPPGRYRLLFASGTDWRNEAAQFGPETERFSLAPPLTFGATVSQKNGYLVDLRDPTEITVRDFAICQRFVLEPESLRRPGGTPERPFGPRDARRYETLGYALRSYALQSRVCD